MILSTPDLRATLSDALDTWDGDALVTKQHAANLLDHLTAALTPDGSPAVLLTGEVPSIDHGGGELLVTVWADGSGEYALRDHPRATWGIPHPLTPAP